MNRKYKKIMEEVKNLRLETDGLKNQISAMAKSVEELKNQLDSAMFATSDGDEKPQSYGKLILDEISALKKKSEGFTSEGLRAMINDVAALKNKLEGNVQGVGEFSLAELKGELLKLADMMTV